MGHPAVRRGLIALAALAVAAAGIAVLIGALDGSGASTTDAPAQPGVATPAATGALGRMLAAGNVVLAYRDPADGVAAARWARQAGGARTPALVASGQAVLPQLRPGQTERFAALAHEREQTAASLEDPALTTFADAWLGRGAAPSP